MKQKTSLKACSTGWVENEKPNGKDRKSQSVTSRARLRAEAARAAHSAHKGTSHMCKGTQHPPKAIIYATVTIYSFFLRIQIARKTIMWYHIIH